MTKRVEAAEYCRARDEALRSLDWQKVKAFMVGHNGDLGLCDEAYRVMMHKVRLGLATFSDDEKDFSRKWLERHGYKAELFGVQL